MNRMRLFIMSMSFVAIVLTMIGVFRPTQPQNLGHDMKGVVLLREVSTQESPVRARQPVKYDVGRVIRNSNEPFDVYVVISIDSRNVVRDEMIKLARQLNQDFSDSQILVVDILDDAYIAHRYMPVANEYTIFNEARRGVYRINRVTYEEHIEFSTERGNRLDEVTIDLTESSKPK